MAEETTTFPLNGPIDLVCRLGFGSVSVIPRDDPGRATVGLTPRQGRRDLLDRFTVEMRGSTLMVTGPRQAGLAEIIGGWRRGRDGVDAVIEAPTDTPVKVASASEEITVTGRCGDTSIATGAARITLDEVHGDLRLRYGTSQTRVSSVSGSVELSAGGGRVELGQVGGSLECRFGTGDLSAEVVRGDLRSRAGTASAQLGAVYGDVDLALGAGSVSIGIPAGVAAHLDVTSGIGQVHSEIPVEQNPAPASRTIHVRARTGAGDIRLQRAAA